MKMKGFEELQQEMIYRKIIEGNAENIKKLSVITLNLKQEVINLKKQLVFNYIALSLLNFSCAIVLYLELK